KQKSFDKVTFAIAGRFSREFSKLQYKIKIRGKKDLYGRTQLKLRADGIEPTYLRSKLIADIHNRLGLPSTSAGYTTLYINDEYMGLYILTDSYKLSWIESVFGEKDTTSLYKCVDSTLTYGRCNCENENEDVTDKTEWYNFIGSLDRAESIEDVENILDVDQFLSEMAIDYLTAGWDHIQSEHNYHMYKPKDGKWLYLSYDFDLDLQGHDFYPVSRFRDYTKDIHILEVLIVRNPDRFDKIVQDIVTKVFNPATLFPYIDELKDLIREYVKKDKELDENGNYPGRINEAGFDFFTYEAWEANSEYTTVSTLMGYAFGIKYWILSVYRFVCTYYHMECDPTYMDENYQYVIDENVEYQGLVRKSTFAERFEETYKYKDPRYDTYKKYKNEYYPDEEEEEEPTYFEIETATGEVVMEEPSVYV
ncbi:hypothetical protein PIROE2DRAFT_12438, partial [Piromyces sp. E2]